MQVVPAARMGASLCDDPLYHTLRKRKSKVGTKPADTQVHKRAIDHR